MTPEYGQREGDHDTKRGDSGGHSHTHALDNEEV